MLKIFIISVTAVFFTLLPCSSRAQADTAHLDQMIVNGSLQYLRKSYDSSLAQFLSALNWIKERNMLTNARAIIIYNFIGDSYFKKNDPTHAHQYYTLALKESRRLHVPSEKATALVSLLELHRAINQRDMPFNYPHIAETEEAEVYFPVGKTIEHGDSVDVTLFAGRLDGISDSIRSVDLYTHYSATDTVYHQDINFYGSARVLKLENNNTLVRVKKHPEIVLLKGDFASVRANIPLSWRKLSLRKFLLNGLFFVDNSTQPLYHFRYFYYFLDSLLENDVMDGIKFSISEIVDAYASDTLSNPRFIKKTEAGIFAGENLIKAMSMSESEHFRLFLNFVNKYPAKYIGNNYKISETYATWIINNTPLNAADVKPWLLSIKSLPEQKWMAFNLRSDIRDEKLIDKWLDEGMQQANIENIRDAMVTATLITHVTEAIGDSVNDGWADYLFANIEKRMSRGNRADSFLKRAAEKFTRESNREGNEWVTSTSELWKKGNRITVGVQNGHILPYSIAQSKNPRYFATGSSDNLIKIWDRTLGKEILTLRGHTDEINSLHYSPNGRYLVSVAEDSMICVWNAYTYTLLYKYKTPKPERVARFSPDNQFIVSAGEDSLIKFRELHTGKIIKTLALHKGTVNDLFFHPVYDHLLYSAGSDSLIYKWNTGPGEMARWYRQQGKALSVKLSNDGNYMSVVSTDSLVTVWNTITNKKMFWGKVHVNRPGTTVFYASESFTPDNKYIAYPYAKDSFLVLRIQDLYERVYHTTEKSHNLCDLQFTDDGLALLARFDLGGPLRIYNFAGWDIRNSPNISWRDIKPYANLPLSVQFTKDDNGLLVLHSEVSRLDLQSGNNQRLYYGYSKVENPYLLLDNEDIGTFIDIKKPILNFYDYKKLEIVQSFALPDSQEFECWELSPLSRYCFMGSRQGMINAWDVKQNKLLFSRTYDNGSDTVIRFMRYDPFNERLFAVMEKGSIMVINPRNGDPVNRIQGLRANYLACSPRFIYITSEDGWLYKLDALTLEQLKKIKVNDSQEDAYYMAISDDHRFLVLQNTGTSLMTIRLDTDSILYSIKDHDYGGTLVAISHDAKRIATAGFDSKVNLYETVSGKLIVSIHYPMNKNVLVADEEGHYLAAKNTLDAISFTYNNNAYSFDQFDVQLNRPDIILAKIGRADSSLIRTYHAAYKKRLSRLKIDERNIGQEVHLPLVRLQDRFAVEPVTTNKEFELTIECSDSRYPLQSLQVLVNNSPLLGMSGLNLLPLRSQNVIRKIKVPLSSGNNNIRVFCTNSKGVVSLSESFSIISKYKPEKPPRNYFIGIGVSNYKDSKMNLQYAAKDIRDLAKTFDDLYPDITFDTLIDGRATKENILALKKKLLQTTVNDRVILAVTGHGLLSDSLDFYYATWDVDFNRPEKRGLRYEDLENLLTDIPARQKLMLIDACHSGALDKEELNSIQTDQKAITMVNPRNNGVKGRAPRGFGLKNKKEKMSANSSFEMMQNLFTDLSGSNGAVIISAAGGMEYAFEGDNWKNGVFTYCVRTGINGKAADLAGNFDGKLTVSELLMYVSQKVSELTNGKQKPTSRRENIEYDWLIRVFD